MNKNLYRLIDRFAGLRITVIGEAMLDVYAYGDVSRLCREAPVPIVSIREENFAPGGAANTAANLAALGVEVRFLSVVGHDTEAGILREALNRAGVSTEFILVSPGRRTLIKRRIIGAQQLLARLDEGSTEAINGRFERLLIERLGDLYRQSDVIIASDYGYGVLTTAVIEQLARCQAGAPRILVVDSKNLAHYRDVGVTVVKPNYAEALRLLGSDLQQWDGLDRLELVRKEGPHLLEITGAQIVAVTLDREGAMVFEADSAPYRTYAEPRPDSHAAGAGDTFIATFALALAAGGLTQDAAELASAAAELVVQKNGTTTYSLDDLRAFLAGIDKHIDSLHALAHHVEAYRRQGKRIVFTNGCFDILHRGHVSYLNRAKELGDVLIVGVNSDASVARLKGPERPINSLEDRRQVLAALSCIDHTVAFEEDTPCKLIEAVCPDVFVKGGDYTRETLPEASLVEALGGKVEILAYVDEHSTSRIIDRIRTNHAAEALGELQTV
ncbi:MAG: D-glycero-beta-D-manno-heptose 1-phosphate adenylyltransferase [Chloroflexota bacterium]